MRGAPTHNRRAVHRPFTEQEERMLRKAIAKGMRPREVERKLMPDRSWKSIAHKMKTMRKGEDRSTVLTYQEWVQVTFFEDLEV